MMRKPCPLGSFALTISISRCLISSASRPQTLAIGEGLGLQSGTWEGYGKACVDVSLRHYLNKGYGKRSSADEADRVQCQTRAAWSLGARTGPRPVLTG